MKIEESEKYGYRFKLSTGKTFAANNFIIGLEDFELTEGYDGYLDTQELNLTKDEKLEIANYVLGKWQQYIQFLKEEELDEGI